MKFKFIREHTRKQRLEARAEARRIKKEQRSAPYIKKEVSNE